MTKLSLVALVGSTRPHSTNERLIQYIQRRYKDQLTIEMASIQALPIFDQSSETSASPALQSLNDLIEAADGVIIATPEYNHSIPAVLKNTLEWLSFKHHPFVNKPVMIVGASYDQMGSARAQLHLRQILDAPGLHASVMPGHEFLLGRSHEAFDQQGDLTHSKSIELLDTTIKRFRRFVRYVKLMNDNEEEENTMFEPGEYTVSATGYGGVLPMIVTFSEDRIEDIVIDPSNETGGYVGPVIRDLIPDILEDQSTEVDLVTGATITSQAVIHGVLEAIELAGGDPNQFQ